ncbi:MAG TPA: phosphate ABC transporter substrate-binding protein PstS [Candidatus Binataceae bacterium]|nr:phosphate ABC transporter substrate-binding protein PstS [Candidatus Binataceae bacterium]
MKKLFVLVLLSVTLAAGAVGLGRADLLINGAGATFPYPIYSKWFDEYAKANPGIHFNYQSIGSGGGIRMYGNKTVDFGASDAPLTDAQIASVGGQVFHFPTVMGGVVVAYNIPGFSGDLKLTGPVIADIFSGKITKWNDPKIKDLNPGANLPDTDIVVCHRSDGSGTTYIFSDYLSKVSPAWAADPGKATALKWPTGLGGKGNEGVTALVQQTPGAIGYIELIYALNNNIPFAVIQNKSGNWVKASLEGVTAACAADGDKIPDDFRVSITDAPGADAYPISSMTYLLIYPHYADKDKGEQIKKFLEWALHDGQSLAPALHYAPLPPTVVQREDAQINKITF